MRVKLELQSRKEETHTALRIAAAGKYIEFLKELVKIMEAEDLAKPNKHGGTALFYAAASGRESDDEA